MEYTVIIVNFRLLFYCSQTQIRHSRFFDTLLDVKTIKTGILLRIPKPHWQDNVNVNRCVSMFVLP